MDDPGPVSEENGSDTLMNICINYCIRHLETFCRWDPVSGTHVLRDGLTLPSVICEALLQRQHARRPEVLDDAFLQLFADPDCTRLHHVDVSNCTAVTDAGLHALLPHRLTTLNITNCIRLTNTTLTTLNRHGGQLQSLVIDNPNHILPKSLDDCDPCKLDGGSGGHGNKDDAIDVVEAPPDRRVGLVLNTPNLRQLVLKNFQCPSDDGSEYMTFLLCPLEHLTYLDVSGCSGLGDLLCLVPLRLLTSLTLYDVPKLNLAITNICELSNLRHLDISQKRCNDEVYPNPNQVLTRIALSLPLLSSLDISGTNLGGDRVEDCPDKDTKCNSRARPENRYLMVKDIPGLRSRVQRPLDFLGLLKTSDEACHRECIPAHKVAGDANEQQILTAAKAYLDRPEVLQRVLNDLLRIFRPFTGASTCQNPQLALKLTLQAMQHNLTKESIQIYGIEILCCIVRGEEIAVSMNIKLERMIISTTLDAMCKYKTNFDILRNGYMILYRFCIQQDVLFDYRRVVEVSLHIFSVEEQDDLVLQMGVYLIKNLPCQVDGVHKQLMGELGAIQVMLQLIRSRLRDLKFDEVMQNAWSIIWIITDDTPINCKRFLENGGMDTFRFVCLFSYPKNPELLRNMMGVIKNVAEVKSLRPMMMSTKYILILSNLLEDYTDGIEVSYSAAGILSHITSDGHGAWTLSCPTRQEVLQRIARAIACWDIRTKRIINCHSIKPFFRLLKVDHTPEAQHWAVWALANLTSIYPEKYCTLVKEEGGLQMLEELIKKESLYWRIKELAQLVITHCDRFIRFGTVDG